MKYLFVLLIFISLKNGLSAQATDSTRMDSTQVNNMNNNNMSNAARTDSTPPNTMTSRTDSMNMNNSNNAMNPAVTSDSTGATMNVEKNDSSQVMSNTTTPASSSVNNSGNMSSMTMSNSMNVKGMRGYAALPVMESYVPDDIISKIQSKYSSSGLMYDITAILAAAPHDSAMAGQNTTMANQDSSKMQQNSSMTPQDTAHITPQYNYMVRMIKDGSLHTEWVGSDGTTSVTPGELNKQY